MFALLPDPSAFEAAYLVGVLFVLGCGAAALGVILWRMARDE